MKPQIEERDVRTSGISLSEKMGIASGQEHIIYDVLRKKMYKDAIKSIWREYAANAYDEHVRLNKVDVPFVVQFPNSLSSKISIRDFGRGLTDEQVMYFFGKFGASDKRENNNQIGCFGLGNKVGHAYGDSFIVTSFLNGVKSTFNVYIGKDKNGDIAKMGESVETDEPNGVEVSIAVKPEHISTFINKGIEVLKYFPTKTIVKGVTEQPDFDRGTLVTSGTGWEYYSAKDDREAVCMMGPVAYEIDSDSMGGYYNLEDYERELLNSNLHIHVAIGDVDVTSSRESLEFTDRTKAAIKAKLKTIRDEMIAQTEKDLANAQTEFEARSFYYSVIQHGGGFGNIVRSSLGRKLKWNGIEIDGSTIQLYDDTATTPAEHQIITYTINRYRRESITYLSEHRLVCTPDIAKNLYYDDTDKKAVNYKRRAKTLFDADNNLKEVWIVKTDNPADFEKRTGLKVKDLKSYKVIVPTFVSTALGTGAGIDKAKRKKHQTRVFELDLSALQSRKSAASDNWTVKNVDLNNDDGLYLRIDRFQPTNSLVRNINGLRSMLNNLTALGIKLDKPIYGLKSSVPSTGKLKDFDTWAKEQVEAIPNLLEDMALAKESSNLPVLSFDKTKVPGKILDYINLYNRAYNCKYKGNFDKKKSLCEKFGISLPSSTKCRDLYEDICKEYPLLKYVSSHYHLKPEVVEYVNSEPKTEDVSIVQLAQAATA